MCDACVDVPTKFTGTHVLQNSIRFHLMVTRRTDWRVSCERKDAVSGCLEKFTIGIKILTYCSQMFFLLSALEFGLILCV